MPGVGVTREQVQAWLDAYIDAWNDLRGGHDRRALQRGCELCLPPRRRARARPRGDRGELAREPDEARPREAGYAPLLVDGDRAVATGETVYTDGRRFSNLFVLRFDAEGRCSEFVEWFVENPAAIRCGAARRSTASPRARASRPGR